MNVNALPGMGPNGSTRILLYTADDDHKNVKLTPTGFYPTRNLAMKVARRMIDWIKEASKSRVVTPDDIDIFRRQAETAVRLYGY